MDLSLLEIKRHYACNFPSDVISEVNKSRDYRMAMFSKFDRFGRNASALFPKKKHVHEIIHDIQTFITMYYSTVFILNFIYNFLKLSISSLAPSSSPDIIISLEQRFADF